MLQRNPYQVENDEILSPQVGFGCLGGELLEDLFQELQYIFLRLEIFILCHQDMALFPCFANCAREYLKNIFPQFT